MTSWEPPSGPRRGRTLWIVGIVVAVVGLARLATGDPGRDRSLVVADPTTTALEADVVSTPVAWPRPQPGLWRRLPASPLVPRRGHAVVSTARNGQVLVWGGVDAAGRPTPDGAVYGVATGVWRRLPANGARDSRAQAAWTGREVVTVSATETRRYDPAEDRWRVAARIIPPRGLVRSGPIRATGASVVALLVPAHGTAPGAVLALDAGETLWRRLPDPPLALRQGDLLLADDEQLLVFAPARDGGAGAVATLPLTADDPTWELVATPPGFTARRVGRLTGALTRGRVVLLGTGSGTDDDGADRYAVVFDRRRWRRVDDGPISPGRHVDTMPTGDGLVVWHRRDGRGAVFNATTARWSRVFPAPLAGGIPRPATWTGSGVLVWGGFDGEGAMYTPR